MNANTEVKTGHDFIKEANDIAVHWWSLIEATLAHASHGHGKEEPLPAWAVQILRDAGDFSPSYTRHREALERAHDVLRLAEGDGSAYRYEVWTERGHRLEIQHESLELARAACEAYKPKYPDAFVCRVHIKSPVCRDVDMPGLIDTLIGRIWWAGTTFGENPGDDDTYHLQDETGRTASISASALRAHQSVHSRLSPECRDRLEACFELDRQQEAARKAVAA